jgi:ABC-type transport system substrate-binding protein
MIGLSWVIGLSGLALAKTPEVLLPAPPTTLHPLYPWTREDHYVHELVHERLFEPDGRGGYESDVVEKWQADGAVVELHLARREWHDGRPFVAADVCATLERIRAADRPTAFTAQGDAAISSCVAGDDDDVVRITLTQPDPDPRGWLSLPLIPAHDPDWAGAGPQSSLAPLGLGRYSVERTEEGWLLKRASRSASYKKLLLRVVPSPARALAEGEGLGAPFVDPEELATARNIPGVSLLIEPATEVWALVLNPSRGPLADPTVRDALDRSLDRQALAEAWLGRDGELPTQPWSLASGPFVARSSRGSAGVPLVERDVEAARQALAAAGLVSAPEGWSWNGTPWSLRVAVPLALGPEPSIVQRTLSEQLGVRVEVVPLTQVQWWFSLQAGGHGAVTDAALVPVPSADPGSVLHTRTERAGIHNPFGFSDPTLDALLDGTLDEDAAHSLQTRLADLDPALFLFSVDGRSAWRTDVKP